MSTKITAKLPEKVQRQIESFKKQYTWEVDFNAWSHAHDIANDAGVYLRALFHMDLITSEEFDQIYDDITEEGNKIWKEKHA